MLANIMNSSDTQNPSTIPKQIIPTSYLNLPFPNDPFSPFRTVEVEILSVFGASNGCKAPSVFKRTCTNGGSFSLSLVGSRGAGILSHMLILIPCESGESFWFCQSFGGATRIGKMGVGFPTVLRELECLTQLLTATIQEIVVTHLLSRGKVMSSNVWWFNIMLWTVLHRIFPINTHTFQEQKRCNIPFLKKPSRH